MRFFKILALSLCALSPQIAIGADQPPSPANNTYTYLGQRLQQRIDAMEWGGARLRILVEDADLPIRAYERNADVGFVPGALMQVVSSAAILDALGKDFHFTTELRIFGVVQDRVLTGGVVARGTGDPSLSSQRLGRGDLFDPMLHWAKLLKAEGIRSVEGPVVADDTYFDDQLLATGCPNNAIGEAMLPSVAALNFNHNVVEIDWKASRREDAPARYSVFPNLPDFVYFSSHVIQRSQLRVPLNYSRVRDGNMIAASGDILVRTRRRDYAAIQNPAMYFATALRSTLLGKGIDISGAAVSLNGGSPGVVTGESRILDTQLSPPLDELLGWALRKNSSLEFDAAFKMMGRRFAGDAKPGSFVLGGKATDAFLTRLHAPPGNNVLLDASGRSQLGRLTCEQILWVLRSMRQHPGKEAYQAFFPRAAEADSVLARRFVPKEHPDMPSAQHLGNSPPIWGVVSSSDDHQAAAGWTNSQSGRTLSFVIAAEGSTLPDEQVRRQIDALVLEVASGGNS